MKGFLFLCGLALSLAVARTSGVEPCSTCPTYGPLVRCPPCVNAQCTPPMCNEAVSVPFPGDCSKFCICDSEGAIEMSCPPGLEWDNVNKICNWASDANCDSSGGCAAPTTTTKPPTTTTKPPTTTTKPPTTTTTKPPTTTTRAPTTTTVPNDPNPTLPCETPAPGPLVRCPDCVNAKCTPNMCNQATGVPYPGDCTKFCICDNGGAIEMSCPPGLEWDNVNKICNWASDANCNNPSC